MSTWILNHEANEGMKVERSEISKEQKYKIIKEYVLNDLSQSQIQKKYGIKSRASIPTWKEKNRKRIKIKRKKFKQRRKGIIIKNYFTKRQKTQRERKSKSV